MFCYDLVAVPSGRLGAGQFGGTDGSGATARRSGAYVLVGMALSSDGSWRQAADERVPQGGSGVADVLAICPALTWMTSVML